MSDAASPLSADLLNRIHERAADHDREASFPSDDLADLVDAGYLKAFVPVDQGGLGLTLEQVARAQVALAKAAPATALAINMHLVVTGVAALRAARGDHSSDFILHDAAAGEIYAFGNSEAGNDLVMFDSATTATTRADGSVAFTGRKIFTTLSPVWTRLATFGRDDADPDHPTLVHAVLSRDTPGITVLDDWDVLGMRATRSCTTLLDDAVAPADRVHRRLPVGPSGDVFIFSLFAAFELLLSAVYVGIGERAVELAVESARRRRSRRLGGLPLSADPDIRWKVAEAAIIQDGLPPQLFGLCRDVDELVDHGQWWFPKMVGLKTRCTETAREVVDQAIRVTGGFTLDNRSEIGRLYRDVLAGLFHPSDPESAHATVAKAWLGPIPEPSAE